MVTVPLMSCMMTGGGGATVTAQTYPALYIRGFQTGCLVVGGIGLIAVACAFVPEGRKTSQYTHAASVRLAYGPGPKQ